jgi:hypothetical protein
MPLETKCNGCFILLFEVLNRHRGKGQQKVTVEHVHVQAGGQAIVGSVGTPGGGVQSKLEEQPDCKANCARTSAPDAEHAPSSGNPCQSPAMKNGRCRMHGGKSSGAPGGIAMREARSLHGPSDC